MDQINMSSEEVQSKVNGVLEKIKTAKSQLFSILDDFAKYYVLHKKAPDSNEYATIYNQNVSQIQGLQTEVFNINNAVERSSEVINDVKKMIDQTIKDNKTKISELEAKIQSLNGGDEALIMKTDFVNMYNLQYIANFCMFVGIIVVCALFGILFKQTGSSPSSSNKSISSAPIIGASRSKG